MSVKTIDTAFEGNALPAFKEVKLKEIVTENCLGGNYQCVADVTPLPVMKMGNLGRGTINLGKIEYVSDGKILSDRDVLNKGDILFNTRNTLDLVGKVAMWRGELEQAVFNSNIMRITFSANVLNEYMNYYFNSYSALKQLRARATGTTSVAAIYWRDCRNIRIPLPPLSEQKAIADLLSTWDEAIEKTEKLIQSKEKLYRWLSRRLFNHNDSWTVTKLGRICSVSKGKQLNVAHMNKDGAYYALNGGIEPSGRTDDWNTEAETITISEGGNSCGYVNYNTERFWSGGHCYSLLNLKKNVDKHYLYFYLKMNELKLMKLRVGSGLPNIQKKDVDKFEVALPSLAEQQQIVQTLSAARREIDLLKQLAEKYKTQKHGLMQKMLTGEWRVKPEIVNQYMEA